MGIVFSSFTTSLDGFIADANGQAGCLFDWYNNGEVELTLRGYGLTFHMSQASADYWHQRVCSCSQRLVWREGKVGWVLDSWHVSYPYHHFVSDFESGQFALG